MKETVYTPVADPDGPPWPAALFLFNIKTDGALFGEEYWETAISPAYVDPEEAPFDTHIMRFDSETGPYPI